MYFFFFFYKAFVYIKNISYPGHVKSGSYKMAKVGSK